MRTLIILAAMAISLGGLAYRFASDDAASEPRRGGKPETETASGSGAGDKLDKLAGALDRYQKTNQEHQARLDKKLADFNARLRSLETTRASPSDGTGPHGNPSGPDGSTGKPEPKIVTEADVSHWMEDSLRAGSFDKEATEQAREQAIKSIAKMPGVNLDDLQCGKGFCRATFAQDSGEAPEIGELFGEPPFENEGFTVNEADGRVSLYFARQGGSLEAFRNAAQQRAAE